MVVTDVADGEGGSVVYRYCAVAHSNGSVVVEQQQQAVHHIDSTVSMASFAASKFGDEENDGYSQNGVVIHREDPWGEVDKVMDCSTRSLNSSGSFESGITGEEKGVIRTSMKRLEQLPYRAKAIVSDSSHSEETAVEVDEWNNKKDPSFGLYLKNHSLTDSNQSMNKYTEDQFDDDSTAKCALFLVCFHLPLKVCSISSNITFKNNPIFIIFCSQRLCMMEVIGV